MIISVASGKGGTGKTTVAVNLALSLENLHSVQFLDCDVEEPNAHFFLKPHILQSKPVFLPIPEIVEEKCTYCGNRIILTVNRGGIEKYIPRALKLCKEFELDKYTIQRMELIEEYIESLTNNPKIRQQKLSDFF